jgi:virginiamycin B lyase
MAAMQRLGGRIRRLPTTVAAPALLAALLVLPLALAPRSEAFVYWANGSVAGGFGSGGAIGRAELDGSGAGPSFITGAEYPYGLTVDSGHVYWTNSFRNTIGRANLDGTEVNQSFIFGVHGPFGVAVDASHIYWTNGQTTPGTIGRANLDGSGVDESFISGADTPYGVAVDASHIYWTNTFTTNTIGRASLDGSQVNQSFITGADSPTDVAVDANHIYWTNRTGTIGRADLDGNDVSQSFIPAANAPFGVAVDGGHVYWTNDFPTSTIGRADIDGTGVDQTFITSTTSAPYSTPYGLVVDNPAPADTDAPQTRITKGAPKKTEKSRVKFKFRSSEQGSTFECKLDAKRWKRCDSPKTVRGLVEGKHKFRVRAIDPSGNVDPTPAKDKFRVVDE